MIIRQACVRSADDDVRRAPLCSKTAIATDDLLAGLTKSWMWITLAVQDLKLRYRGSVLGPFWLTIGTAVMVAAMGILYAELFKKDVTAYLPYVATGLVEWQFVSTVINEGCLTFLMSQNIIQQVQMPFSIHAYRTVCRSVMVLGHNFVIILIVFAIFPPAWNWGVTRIIPAFILLIVNGMWISVLLGMISARFRDVPPIVANFVQVVFLVTPVFWPTDALGRWKFIEEFNPFFAMVDLLRAPLLGTPAEPHSWALLLATTVIGSIGTFFVFARFRARIAFWV